MKFKTLSKTLVKIYCFSFLTWF